MIFLKKTSQFYTKNKQWLWFVIGLAAVFVYLVPYYVLKGDAYFLVFDELDDGIVKYMLTAKYFGQNPMIIPEFMGGQSPSAITVSSVAAALLYKIFKPLTAFIIMMTVELVTAYTGLYLLNKKITGNPFVGFFVGAVFTYLPFRPMFALNIVGFPLLLWAVLELAENDRKKCFILYACVAYFALGTTMVLGGYLAIGFIFVAIIVLFAIRKKYKANIKNLIAAEGILIAVECITSIKLIIETFIKNDVVSHREEMVATIEPNYLSKFKQMLFYGGGHSECCSKWIALSSLVLIVLLPFFFGIIKKSSKETFEIIKKEYIFMVSFYAVCIVFIVFSCVWTSPFAVEIRTNLGGVFKDFQFDRMYWTMPTCWMAVMMCELGILFEIALLLAKQTKKIARALTLIPVAASLTVMILYSVNVYYSSYIYHNLRLVVFPETYHVQTWNDFFAEPLFEDIGNAIGKDKSQYRVVSIGLEPAVSLYNGFSTIDGYCTNYPLEYKHRFRKIMEKEFTKEGVPSSYFDGYGSRCYLYVHGLDGKNGIRKDNTTVLENVELNIEALKELGGNYIFSALEIGNADELGLKLIDEAPFERDDCVYRVWVYEVN